MAIGAYFHPASMNADQYSKVLAKLEAAGAGRPPGRLYHSCLGSGDGLQVYDVWASQEQFDAFGAVLMPILAEIGVDPGQPMIAPIHNTIVG